MDIWLRIIGGLLVTVALGDIFLTVLYARSDAGIVTPLLTKGGWRCLKRLAALFGPGRHRLLSLSGPLLLVLIATTWVLLLAFGFALAYWPELGTGLRKSQGMTPTDFLSALYFSGFCLTTLGVGDIAPTAGHTKMLTILEAALGFSFFTLTITYFLSIYSALQRRNTLGSILHAKCGGTGDPVALVALLGSGTVLAGARNDFSDLAARVADLLEAHIFYPVLHYFHFRRLRHALPRMTYILMDSASLLRTLPIPGREVTAPGVLQMQNASRDLLQHLADVFVSRDGPENYPPTAADLGKWREHFRAAEKELRERDVPLPADLSEAEEAYLALRRDWHPFIAAFSASLGYELEEIIAGT